MNRRTWAIALGLSVALNLFFLGVVVARALQPRHWFGPPEAGHRVARVQRGGAGGRFEPLRWLSDEQRAELRPRRKALRRLRRQVEDALRREPFDAAELRGQLRALHAETRAIQARVHDMLVERAAQMSAEERRRLVDTTFRRGRKRGPSPGDRR